ncbi:YlxR family protein [Demequina oxidasica]|uniref:YlxR family protein n=1 Tax=Demequina oxidasica TaxID=676199 RepID=UPI000785E5A0|nr:YlxR family protein [Demequina oxidasica]
MTLSSQPLASRTPASDPSGPVRTCVGCRKLDAQSVLMRVVLDGNLVVADLNRSLPGRGAWLHRSDECLATALQRRAFGRAFRAPQADASGITLES